MSETILFSPAREQRVLSFLNLDGAEAMQLCAEAGLAGEMFYGANERKIFDTAGELHASGQLQSGEILAEEVCVRRKIMEPREFLELTQQIPRWGIGIMEIPALARAMRRLKRERDLNRAAQDVSLALKDNDHEKVKLALAILQNVDVSELPRATWSQTGTIVIDRARAIIAGTEDPDHRTIPWPWRALDIDLKPFRRGELVVVAGFASLGKSSLLRQLTLHAARQEMNVAFVSLEVPAGDIFQLMASAHSRQPWSRLKGLVPSDQEEFLEGCQLVRGLSIDVLADCHSLPEIIAWIRNRHARRFIDVLAIDYLGLIDECQPQRGQSKAAAVGEVAGAFKRLAMDLGCVIFLAVQINRGPMNDGNREPKLTDLKDSGDIEAHADRALLLYRPDQDRTSKEEQSAHDTIAGRPRFYMELFQEKGRNVGTGSQPLWFRRELAMFELMQW